MHFSCLLFGNPVNRLSFLLLLLQLRVIFRIFHLLLIIPPYPRNPTLASGYHSMSSGHLRFIRLLPFMLLLVLQMCEIVNAQDTVKVMSYNLLNYPELSALSADTSTRNPEYRRIIQAANPDILVVQESNSQAGFTGFLNNVMNANGVVYGAASYVNSNDTEQGLFYRLSKFQFISNTAIPTSLRNINEFRLVHIQSGDTLRVYGVHLKASTGSANEQQRASEVDSLRKRTNSLPPGTNFLVCGDMNLYGSFEPAYQKLLQIQSGNEGHFYDALNLSGTWNSSSFAIHHTQSPRVRSFNGGAIGGMDDRFDLILYSKAVRDAGGVTVVPGSLKAFGNDGLHYNDSINRMPNNAVSQAVANALHNASDHIPILLSITFPSGISSLPDAGMTAIIPPSSNCPASAGIVKARVKNFASQVLNFSSKNLQLTVRVQAPQGGISTLVATLNSGSLAPGTDTLVTLPTSASFSTTGNYVLSGFTTISGGDAVAANDSSPQVVYPVSYGMSPVLQPVGPLTICNGNIAKLTVSGGAAWLWSNGSTTSSVDVTVTGNYSVTVTGASGCTMTLGPVSVTVVQPQLSDTVFRETMGSVSTTTSISAHEANNGFLNDQFLMEGTGDIRSTTPSTGYPGFSADANVFLTTGGRTFIIRNINTTAWSNLSLSFGIHKNSTTSSGTDFLVQYSTGDTVFTNLALPPLPTGTGTATWYYRTVTGVLPRVPSLVLRFVNNSTTTQYRIDDVLLSGSSEPQITASSIGSLCTVDSIVLTSSSGSSYVWNTGATTQSITVDSGGVYSVTVDCIPSAGYTVQSCNSPVLAVKCMVEGLYLTQSQMIATLFEAGISGNPSSVDTLELQMVSPLSPYPVVHSAKAIVQSNGQSQFVLPAFTAGQAYYLVVRLRNTIPVWSKQPVVIGATLNSFDFSTP